MPTTSSPLLQNRLRPNLRLLHSLLPSEADLLAVVRRCQSIILSNLQKFVPVQTILLLDAGLPLDNILKLIMLMREMRHRPVNGLFDLTS
ncbi:hypothetical protein KSP39_PZI008192 [Platanthera zijinensis]|uniref:Uncharacterized protein n=1 Tax=Platanthera zijinensis TaxID=2320716 RepID=A0AAP0BPQ1_9ASPA